MRHFPPHQGQKQMQFIDQVSVSGTRRTEDGYLVATARCVRTGIQLYSGRECGMADMDVVRVYRAPEEVFARDSLQSFSHAPITNDHPVEPVTGDNWKRLAVGEVSTAAKQDGEWISLPLILKDAGAISAVEAGKRELSAGYTCQLVKEPGITADGQEYDARQVGIKINHLALVDQARAGSMARIGDEAGKWGASPVQPPKKERSMTDATKQGLVVDGLTVSLDVRDAQIVQRHIDSLNSKLADAEKKAKDMAEEKAKSDEEHEKETAKKDAALDDLKAKVLSDADLDARVQARGDLIAAARAIVGDVDFKGKPDAEIRKTVVVTKLGDEAIAGKPQAYIDARFDILAEAVAKGDPIRDAARGNTAPVNTNDAAAAYQRHLDYLSNAWKGAK
jgi:uncharacterized protein